MAYALKTSLAAELRTEGEARAEAGRPFQEICNNPGDNGVKWSGFRYILYVEFIGLANGPNTGQERVKDDSKVSG